ATCLDRNTCRCCGVLFSSATNSEVSSAAGEPAGSTTFRATTIPCGGFRSDWECSQHRSTGGFTNGRSSDSYWAWRRHEQTLECGANDPWIAHRFGQPQTVAIPALGRRRGGGRGLHPNSADVGNLRPDLSVRSHRRVLLL